MRQNWIIFACGVLVFFMPFLGFPRGVHNILIIIIGLLIAVLSLRDLRKTYVSKLYNGGGQKD